MSRSSQRAPGVRQAVQWALAPGAEGGGISRKRLAWRAFVATLADRKSLARWMGVLRELHARDIVRDVPGEFLRAIRPSVREGTSVAERVVQLTDHLDWLETALAPRAFERIAAGLPLVLVEFNPPAGYEWMRLQLCRAPVQSPEGELLLTLTMRRKEEVQQRALPIDAAVLAFSRFRIDGTACFVIGGVRGQRASERVSPVELKQALQGWKPPVLLVRTAQELARWWNLQLVGLDPAAHRLHAWPDRWSRRAQQAGERIVASYRGLWDHFEARNGPHGWVVLPLDADDKLAATALSPEKRARQTRRADFWLRTRGLLRQQFRLVLQRPGLEARLSRVTQAMPRESEVDEPGDFTTGADLVPSRAFESGPATLL